MDRDRRWKNQTALTISGNPLRVRMGSIDYEEAALAIEFHFWKDEAGEDHAVARIHFSHPDLPDAQIESPTARVLVDRLRENLGV